MKRNYFLGAVAAFGLLAFASCSNEEENAIEAGEQVIVLDMQDTDVLSTKSRPLYSTASKGADLVTDVQLLVFQKADNDEQYKFKKKLTAITNWNNSSSAYDYGRKREIKLTGNDKLDKEGTYIILAVGQDESDKNSIPAPFKIKTKDAEKYVGELVGTEWEVNTTWNLASNPGNGFWQTAAVSYAADTQGVVEIFSGVSRPIEFTAKGGFSTTVLLKRQVAGVLGYFNRIPAKVGSDVVTSIRLVASNRNNALDLSNKLRIQADDAAQKQPVNDNKDYVVNGYNVAEKSNEFDARFGVGEATTKDAYAIYTVDLKKWFDWDGDTNDWKASALLDEKGEGDIALLGKAEGWHNGLDAANAKVTVADGAVLAGQFVIPFEKNTKNTFELQLLDANQKVLKTWSVKLDPMSQAGLDGDKVYNIYRNHLYQVGKRGNGDNPTNPGVDPDKPQPLDKDQELVIRINDQWEFIHDMEIE